MLKRIKRMNKWLFMAVFLSPLLYVCVMTCMLLLKGTFLPEIFGIIILVGIIMFSVSMPVFCYSTWVALYDEEHYMPSKKLPPPFFAFFKSKLSDRYYFFHHYLFMDHFEEYVKRYNLQVPSFNRSVFQVFRCLIFVIVIFTFVMVFLLPLFVLMIFLMAILLAITYFVFLITVSQTCDAINALADAVEERSISIEEKDEKSDASKTRKARHIRRVNREYFFGAFLLIPIGICSVMVWGFFVPFEEIVKTLHSLYINNDLLLICFVVFVTYIVLFIVFYYRMLKVVSDKVMILDMFPTFTGFILFIPIVHMVWIFLFYHVFIKHYTNEMDRYNPESHSVPISRLALYAFPVLGVISEVIVLAVVFEESIVSWIYRSTPRAVRYELLLDMYSTLSVWAPWTILFFALLASTVFVIVVWQVCTAVNRLADAEERGS